LIFCWAFTPVLISKVPMATALNAARVFKVYRLLMVVSSWVMKKMLTRKTACP
jgi:hypothetical protein